MAMEIHGVCNNRITLSHMGMDDFDIIGMGLIQTQWCGGWGVAKPTL